MASRSKGTTFRPAKKRFGRAFWTRGGIPFLRIRIAPCGFRLSRRRGGWRLVGRPRAPEKGDQTRGNCPKSQQELSQAPPHAAFRVRDKGIDHQKYSDPKVDSPQDSILAVAICTRFHGRCLEAARPPNRKTGRQQSPAKVWCLKTGDRFTHGPFSSPAGFFANGSPGLPPPLSRAPV